MSKQQTGGCEGRVVLMKMDVDDEKKEVEEERWRQVIRQRAGRSPLPIMLLIGTCNWLAAHVEAIIIVNEYT